MKYECNMIEDLLPLYKDGVCGPASTKAVEDHLAECPHCREYLEQLRDTTVDEVIFREKEDVIESQSKYFKKKSALAGSVIAAIFAVPILVCLIVNLATGSALNWFFIVLAAMLIPASLFVVPLLVPENKLFYTLTSFTASVIALLGVVCLYTAGKWFFTAASAVLFGLTVLFGPILACHKPLCEFLGNCKGLAVMAACTLTFFLMLVCIGLRAGSGFFRISFGISVPLVILTWVVFLIIRYLPIGKLAKTGAVLAILCAFGVFGTELILDLTMKTPGPGEVVVYSQGSPVFAYAGIAVGATLAVIGILKKVLGGNRK